MTDPNTPVTPEPTPAASVPAAPAAAPAAPAPAAPAPAAPAAPAPAAPAPAAPAGDYPGKTLGIVGLILAFVFTLAGLIVSIIAYNQSKAAGFKNTPAKVGLILSIIFLVLGVLGLLIALVLGVFGFLTSLIVSNGISY